MSDTNHLLATVFVEGKPVSVNHAYRRGKHGKVYLADAANAWKMLVFAAIRQQWIGEIWQHAHLPLEIDLTFYAVRADADNLVKVTLDGVKEAIRIDDRHFSPVSSHVVRSSEARALGMSQG